MKRLFLVLCVLAVSAASWAQLVFPTADQIYSLTRSSTAKLICDEIDQSFTVNSGFGSVQNPFIVTGVLGNANSVSNTGYTPNFTGGFYESGDRPFSLYGSLYGAASGFSQKPTSTVDSATAPTYRTDTTYDAPQIKEFDGAFQGLIKLASFTTGLFFEYHPNNGTLASAAAYSTQVQTYYTTVATPTAPLYSDNYSVTTEFDNFTGAPNYATTNGANTKTPTVRFLVPFDMKSGDLESKAFVSVKFNQADSSGSYSQTTSPMAWQAAAATTVNDIDDELTNTTKQVAFELNYTATISSLLGGDSANKFYAGLDLTYASTSTDYSYSGRNDAYTVGALNTKTLTGTTTDTVDSSYATTGYFGIAAMAAHTLNFKPGDGYVFVLKPQLILSYSKDPNGAYSSVASGASPDSIVYTRTSTGGTTTEITTEYDSSASVATTSAGFNLPAALQIKPESWPFGFFAGSTGYGYSKWTKNTSAAYTVTRVDTPYGGSPTTVYSYSTDSDSKTTCNLVFGETHSFGLFIPFGNNIRADLIMNGNNLLAFDNLQVQLYVPLK